VTTISPTQRPTLQQTLSLRGITKNFGAVRALDNVDIDIHRGEVTALLGDNGAGKSTLVKILSGVYPPDTGRIEFDGVPVTISSPTEAREKGIATVYQDLALCENLDVVANLFLGREEGGVLLSEEKMEAHARQIISQLTRALPPPRKVVAGLSGGQRQLVAIARALVGNPSVIVLDEPTAALGVEQTAEVLELIRTLRNRGHAVLVISHNMADVQRVADRAYVLRLGRNNGVFFMKDTSTEQLVAAITGAANHSNKPNPPANITRE
jgi:D-xylose transport system ATP-binding protein